MNRKAAKSTPAPTAGVTLTDSQFQALVTALRQPVVSEAEQRAADQQKRAEAQLEAEREQLRASHAERVAREQAAKAACPHLRKNGSTPAVYVADLNRLYCQHCASWIFQTVQEAAQNGAVQPERHPALWAKLHPLAAGEREF